MVYGHSVVFSDSTFPAIGQEDREARKEKRKVDFSTGKRPPEALSEDLPATRLEKKASCRKKQWGAEIPGELLGWAKGPGGSSPLKIHA